MADDDENSSISSGESHFFQWPDTPTSEDTSDDLDMDLDNQSEDGLTSLSDSTYEIISQSSLQTSDEENHDDGTESLISFGIPTPDEGSSLDGEEYASPREPYQEEVHLLDADVDLTREQTGDENQSGPASLNASTLRQSDLSTTTITQSAEDWIKFQDPIKGVASGLIDVTKPSKPDFSEDSEHPQRAVRMTISNKQLNLDESFRIIFYTCYPELVALKQPILEKIGQALFLSRHPNSKVEPTMMNIVPISAFDNNEASPDVVLVPSSGLQIHVDDRSGSKLGIGLDRRGLISFWTRQGCCVNSKSTKFPDLFVFVHPGPHRPLHDLQSSLSKSESLKRRGVPVIDICDKPWIFESASPSQNISSQLSAPAFKFRPWRGRAVHVIHPTTNPQGQYAEYAMPIDYAAFQYLEAGDLNSNLGVITYRDSLASRFWSSFQHKFKTRSYKSSLRRFIVTGLLLALLLSPFLMVYRYKPGHKVHKCSKKTVLPLSSVTITSELLPTESILRTLPPPIAPLLLSGRKLSTQTRALTTVVPHNIPCAASLTHRAAPVRVCPTAPNKCKKTPEFHILEASDGRLFLQATKSLSHKWKPSSNFVRAVQGETPLESTLTTINDTTFELHIGESRSCDPIVITIWPNQWEKANQTFELSRSCPPKATFQSISQAYAKIFREGSSSMLLTTSNVFNVVQQHSSNLYSRNLEYFRLQSVEHSRRVGILAQLALGRVHRLNSKVEMARRKFNARADVTLDKLFRDTAGMFKQMDPDFKDAGQLFDKSFMKLKTQAREMKQKSMERQALLYQTAHTNFQRLRDGMHCGVNSELPRFVCKSRLSNKAPLHIKRAKARANTIKERFAKRRDKLWRNAR